MQMDSRLECIHSRLHTSIRGLLEVWDDLDNIMLASSEQLDQHVSISNAMSYIELAIEGARKELMMFGDLNPSIVENCPWRNCGDCRGWKRS
jgi:hypothetical protein